MQTEITDKEKALIAKYLETNKPTTCPSHVDLRDNHVHQTRHPGNKF
jgi:hypothetical protein